MIRLKYHVVGISLYLLTYVLLYYSPIAFGQHEFTWQRELFWSVPLYVLCLFINELLHRIYIHFGPNCIHNYSVWDRNVVKQGRGLYRIYRCSKCKHEVAVKDEE